MKVQGNIDFNSIIQLLKLEDKSSSRGRWCSQSGLRLLSLVTTLLGATGLILAAKNGKVGKFMNFGFPWSFDDHVSSNKIWAVSGLQNLGNNCFLNVVLQALASCSSFRRYLEVILEEYELGMGTVEENSRTLPLTSALASLLEELCDVHDERLVRNPRKVMAAMDNYVPRFNLTSQQDAEEAFFHLLSSLREELLECYVSHDSSLVDVIASHNYRIVSSVTRSEESDQQRWQRSFLGPFDGVIGSILTCQSCSSQISLDFQFFHSLHISPVLRCGGALITECSLEDCLNQFFVSEQLDNYFCSHCWHVAAVKYLSVIQNQADIEVLKQCNEDDSCDCKNLPSLRPLPWSNSFSRTFKQLIIVHCPQIICIHLQRASVNLYGEPVKLLGHISFPLTLDLSPFIKRGIKNLGENSLLGEPLGAYQPSFLCMDNRITQLDVDLKHFNVHAGKQISLGTEIPMRQQTANAIPKNVCDIEGWSNMLENSGSAEVTMQVIASNLNYKGNGPFTYKPSRDHTYGLVSIVQHFGLVGSGHYTVYRRVKTETRDEDPTVLLEPTHAQWFCISDSDVHIVSEKDVLEAEASLLFYEKID